MVIPVTGENLAETLLNLDRLPHRRGRHVGVRDRIQQKPFDRLELRDQLIGQTPILGLDQRTRMMGDQPANQGISAGDVAQVSGAIKRMEAGLNKIRRIADVMEPRGSNQSGSVITGEVGDGLSLATDTLTVRPPARYRLGQEKAREVTGMFDPIHLGRLTNVPAA